MGADQGLVDSVANDNTKAIAGKLAAVSAESFQDYAAHRNRMNMAAEVAFQQWAKSAQDMDPKEALSIVEGMKGSDTLPELMTQLGAVIAQLQQVTKTAQTTPPVTA